MKFEEEVGRKPGPGQLDERHTPTHGSSRDETNTEGGERERREEHTGVHRKRRKERKEASSLLHSRHLSHWTGLKTEAAGGQAQCEEEERRSDQGEKERGVAHAERSSGDQRAPYP